MGLFSSIKHAFQHLGHDIEHVAKDVGHGIETAAKDVAKVGEGVVKGVEQVGKTIGKDIEHVAEHTFKAAEDLMQGHFKQALNQAMEGTQDIFKTAVDVATSGEKAAVSSVAHMHLSKKIDRAMGKAEHAFDKIGEGVKTGVGMVGKQIGKDVATVGKDLAKTGKDVIHGHWQQALDDTVKTAQDGFNTMSDVSTAVGHAAVDSLANMHLGKGMDKAMGKVEKGYNAVTDDIKKSVDQVGAQVVNGTESMIKDTVQAGKDAVHGNWGAALGDIGKAGMSAMDVASDLSPEGAIAAVGTQVLINAHVGSQKLDEAIGGAIHGNFAQTAKGIAKNVGELEIGNAVQGKIGALEDKAGALAEKVMPGGGSGGGSGAGAYAGVAAGAALGIAGSGMSFGGGKRSHASSGGGAGGSSKASFTERLGAMTGRGGSSRSAEGKEGAAGSLEAKEAKEAKKEKEQQRADNAKDAASNTANNPANQPSNQAFNGATGSNNQSELEMLELFMLQAGMKARGGEKKGTASLTADA